MSVLSDNQDKRVISKHFGSELFNFQGTEKSEYFINIFGYNINAPNEMNWDYYWSFACGLFLHDYTHTWLNIRVLPHV